MYRFAPRTQTPAYRPFYRGNTPSPARRYGHDGDWHGHDGDWDHHHHRAVYWYGSVYPYSYWYGSYPVVTGYVNPWLFDNCWSQWYGWSAWCDVDGYSSYSSDVPAPYREYGTDPQQYYQNQNQNQNENQDQPAAPPTQPQRVPDAQPTRPQYSPSSATSPVASSSAPTVIVIFNDGRPPEKIQNYLLTSRTLTVLDPNYREIPLAKVNLAATVQANRAAGVEFRVPVAQ